MLMLSVNSEYIREFMDKLLRDTVFDDFLVRNVEIVTFTKFEISGILDEDVEDRESNYAKWEEIKPYVFDIIKGKRKPKLIKIVFSLDKEKMEKLSNNASALYLNLIYEENKAVFTTAISEKEFSLDKSLDNIWGEYIKEFFKENSIPVM